MTTTNENTMNKTLGQMVGIVKRSCKISAFKGAVPKQITIHIDFTTASDNDIRNWLSSDRTIAGQRPWRTLSDSDIDDLDGQTLVAQNIGQKVKSREERIQDQMVRYSMDYKLASFSLDNPLVWQKIIDENKAKAELAMQEAMGEKVDDNIEFDEDEIGIEE